MSAAPKTADVAAQLSLQAFEECEPLFRWAGGKRRLLSQIEPLLPKKFNSYYEPFCGGAALFFKLRPAQALLNDKNEELINCYNQVKEHPEFVISELLALKNNKTSYYRIRGNVPTTAVGRAARFIYLVTLSFNGIYRVNSSGEFNVPYSHRNEHTFDADAIRSVSKALSSATLSSGDFEVAVQNAKKDDLVYFDPPYTVAHGNNGFVQYNEKILSWDDQIRLAQVARNLAKRGCHIIVSNADHASVEELYNDFRKERVSRFSGVGGPSTTRKQITEFVFIK